MKLTIGDRSVGSSHPAFIIAEVAQAHDGSLGMAHSFVDAAAAAGADAVKFQTHLAAAESSPEEPFRVRLSSQDATRYDYWKRMEFTRDQWGELARHAREAGLVFLSSPFSEEAADLLLDVGVPAWKVASGEITNQVLLDKLAASRLPFLVSTGLSGWDEIHSLVAWLQQRSLPFALFQCTSAYPCPAAEVGLNVLAEIGRRFSCPVGLSDHSGSIFPSLAAATLGASLLEVHVTLSREMFGPDVAASVTTGELRQLVSGVRLIEEMLAHPVDKDAMAAEMQPLRQIFMKSLFTAVDIPAGTVLAKTHLTPLKPGTGIQAARLPEVLGRPTRVHLRKGTMLKEEHLEPS